MRFPQLQQKAEKLVIENASSILTGVGVLGTVATAVLTARSTFKAAELIQAENKKLNVEATSMDEVRDLTTKDKAKLVWPQYIPPVLVGSATIGSIVMANVMSIKKVAALAAAYGISENRFQEYRDKVAEKIGVNKERAVQDEIAQDRVTNNPPDREVVILASGDVLCYDMLTGRYFQSTVENIKKAANYINNELLNFQAASLSQFYEEIGLPATSYTDEVGWNHLENGPVEVKFSTTMSTDDRPCLAIDFTRSPKPDYLKNY